jgi:hypothetical protein
MSDLKSSYELALERLKKKDADAGVVEHPLTDAQRAALAEVRNVYEAKLAQQDVLRHSGMNKTFDPAELAVIDEEYRRERERLIAERDAKLEKIREGSV